MGRTILTLDMTNTVAFKDQTLVDLCLLAIGEEDLTNISRLQNPTPRERHELAKLLHSTAVTALDGRVYHIREFSGRGADRTILSPHGRPVTVAVSIGNQS